MPSSSSKTTSTAKKAAPRKPRARSGNPATRAAVAEQSAPEPTQAAQPVGFGSGWRTGAETQAEPIDLPSGARALVFSPGASGMVQAGVDLEKLDTLSNWVNQQHVQPATIGARGKRIRPEKSSNPLAGLSPEEVNHIVEIADRVTAYVTVSPRVKLTPSPSCLQCGWEGAKWSDHAPEDKHEPVIPPLDPNVYYTDGIDMQDKFAILAFATQGVEGLKPFREKSTETVDSVAAE